MDTSLSELGRVALGVCQDLDTPISLSIAILIRHGEWDQLATKSVDPGSYLCPKKFGRDAAAVGLLKKFDGLPTSFDTRAAAMQAWWEGEKQCFWSNNKLSGYVDEMVYGLKSPLSDLNDPVMVRALRITRKIVYEIVGEAPSLINGRFGPGATMSDGAKHCSVPHKLASDPTMTSAAVWYLPQVLDSAWGRSMCERKVNFRVQNYNRHATVPKNAVTDRSIAVEPSINGFFQLGVGRELRKKLRRYGLDLDTAGQWHAQLARIAARDRELATLDLSNASDTLCRELVTLLLPMSWIQLLEDLRTPVTEVREGDVVRRILLEKFSSMGNGFTFELETLVFLGAALTVLSIQGVDAIVGHNISVFGDDIIIPDCCASLVGKYLNFLGFSVNKSKSFSGGTPFRESCGSDWFLQEPVRPFYVKKAARLLQPAGWISVANGIHALYKRLGITTRRGHSRVLDCLPSNIRRLRGPRELGDLVIHDEDTSRWLLRERSSIWYIRVWRPSLTQNSYVSMWRFDAGVTLASALYGVKLPGGRPLAKQVYGIVCRDPEIHFKEGWTPTVYGLQGPA